MKGKITEAPSGTPNSFLGFPLDPTIMPAVNAPTPGGLNWIEIRKLIHGLVNKGRVLGMDLVEISPAFENGNMSLVHAERLICNFIGATVRAGYYD
jgi:agmatinase